MRAVTKTVQEVGGGVNTLVAKVEVVVLTGGTAWRMAESAVAVFVGFFEVIVTNTFSIHDKCRVGISTYRASVSRRTYVAAGELAWLASKVN